MVGTTTSCWIYGELNASESVGQHTGTIVSLDLSEYDFIPGKTILKCYWGMENEGILSIGAENALRKLAAVDVVKVM